MPDLTFGHFLLTLNFHYNIKEIIFNLAILRFILNWFFQQWHF